MGRVALQASKCSLYAIRKGDLRLIERTLLGWVAYSVENARRLGLKVFEGRLITGNLADESCELVEAVTPAAAEIACLNPSLTSGKGGLHDVFDMNEVSNLLTIAPNLKWISATLSSIYEAGKWIVERLVCPIA